MRRIVRQSPIVFGGGGGYLLTPLQNTRAAATVTLTERVLESENVTATQGVPAVTLANAPIPGTISIRAVGQPTPKDVTVTITSGASVTVSGFDYGNDFIITYRYLDTANTETVSVVTTANTVKDIAIPRHHNVAFTATINAYIVDN